MDSKNACPREHLQTSKGTPFPRALKNYKGSKRSVWFSDHFLSGNVILGIILCENFLYDIQCIKELFSIFGQKFLFTLYTQNFFQLKIFSNSDPLSVSPLPIGSDLDPRTSFPLLRFLLASNSVALEGDIHPDVHPPSSIAPCLQCRSARFV